MGMAYIRLYYDLLESLTPFQDVEVGRLIRGLLQYAKDGTEPKLTGNERFIWPTLRGAVERDAEQYAQKCAKLRENGKYGRGGKPNGFEKNQMVSEEANGFEKNHLPPRKDKDKDKEVVPPYPPQGGATTASYVEDNLRGMSAANWDELRSYLDDGLNMELVNHAVDEACANGKRNWAYVRQILNRYLAEGIVNVEQAKNTKVIKQPEKQKPKYRWVGEDDDC